MVRVVTAFTGEEAGKTVGSMLEKGGIPVRSSCHTGMETVRAIKKMGGGVVVCGSRLRDMTSDQLAFELKDTAFFLVVAKPSDLELCESDEVFRLPAPVRSGELCGSVQMLMQLDQRRSREQLPRRSAEDAALVQRAKELIMEKNDMTEDCAYRFMQRRSMETATPMTEIARMILEALD